MTCTTSVNLKDSKCVEPIKVKPLISRRFLGKVDGFIDRHERNFNKKMLKAYLRGNTHFSFGLTEDTRQPVIFKVEQEYYKPETMGG